MRPCTDVRQAQTILLILIVPLLSVLITGGPASAQSPRKQIRATRVDEAPRIDGRLTDACWKEAEAAGDFVQFEPYNGRPASKKTEVRIVYDNSAMYLGAMMYDDQPDSILNELGKRDEINISDYFGVYIDPFSDYQNAYGFFITPAGVQVDLKYMNNEDEDETWDAVWQSKTMINDSGWVAEYKIPYSALRFPKKETQRWTIGLFRQIERYREKSTWPAMDKKISGMINQGGELTGISGVVPPLRLAFVPYLSGYLEKQPETESWGSFYNAGLDLKYGINESFTLDMTLVPDFGQVQSDDEIYNLTPFEVYYDEKRPFFMEGTELFDKGNVFYSRRVGKEPSGYQSVHDSLRINEKADENPKNAQLINATKLTGKTRGNLGIGVFNAMTANTHAVVADTLSGSSRRILTEPFANYNMLVFDQGLKHNSNVSIFNTNVYKPDYNASANVTGTQFKLTNKANKYAVECEAMLSQHYLRDSEPAFGHNINVSAGKVSGNLTWDVTEEVSGDTYDPNDMGYLEKNNYLTHSFSISYNIYDPFWKMLEWYNNLDVEYEDLYIPRKFSSLQVALNSFTTLKNHLSLWMSGVVKPADQNDFYEPRVAGRYFVRPPLYYLQFGYSPDYRKKFLTDIFIGATSVPFFDRTDWFLSLEPRLRISDKLMIIHEFEYEKDINNRGYVMDTLSAGQKEVIIFGRRNLENFVNTLDVNYRFNSLSSVSFRLRHYWLTGKYKDYYDLQDNGSLITNAYFDNHDFSYNFFTIDLVYYWNFAPGSQLTVVWKNSIYREDTEEDITRDFFRNFDNTLHTSATNSFSIKVLYYLDYQYLKRKQKRT
jgi:hypothetical protein